MSLIVKKTLDFMKTFNYVKDLLSIENTLSKKVVELVNFAEGQFFAFTPKSISKNELYSFRCSFGESVLDEVYLFIYNLVQENVNLSCVFDDCVAEYNSKYKDVFFHQHGKFLDREVYYLLGRDKATIETIKTADSYSDAFFHSLCVLSEAKVNNNPKIELSIQEIEEICQNTKYIFVTAYDSEGCIFWKKK